MKRALCIAMLLSTFAAGIASAQQDARFQCGGGVEAEVWTAWDRDIRAFIGERQLQDRLLKQGDVYALYDVQTYMHNLVSMARRCNRTERLREMAKLVRIAYGALAPGSSSSPGRRWICRGGHICNTRNGLLDKEVMLDSAQFLGLASSIANALASPASAPGEDERAYIDDTVQIAAEHLLRWGDEAAIDRLRKAAQAQPQDVTDNSSALFFTDHELWPIMIYAELSGVLLWQRRQSAGMVRLTDRNKARMRRHLDELLKFFAARTSIRPVSNGWLGNARTADLDRGYWRRLDANRYAGYEQQRKPVVCLPLASGIAEAKPKTVVPAESVRQRMDIGWDFSHARRFVHAFDALERNRGALIDIFSLRETQLPPAGLTAAFAGNLVASVWNGDAARPLFSNYWSGANGWYRVAYDNGTGECREGYPPYGMSEAFLTGGFITWARYVPIIGTLGRTLYDIVSNPDAEQSAFIDRHYPPFSASADTRERELARFMFFCSLVGSDGI